MKSALLFTLLLWAAGWAGEEAAPSPEDLFKWGEYDSLVSFLETRLETPGAAKSDSALQARSHLLLGVAYFATGKPYEADVAFVRACRLDARVQLETFYVSREIAERFEAVAAREKARRAAERPAAPHLPPAPARHAASRTRWWLGGAGAAAAVAALGGAYFIISQEPAKTTVTQIDTRDKK